jgi:hypothetical protein
MARAVDSMLRDKTCPASIAPITPELAQQLLTLTLEPPLAPAIVL